MKHFITALVSLFLAWTPTLHATTAPTTSRPDIVVFLTDDQGQLDSTPYGSPSLRTPHMQRLADTGLTFTRAYVASPSCAPSRAALLTGQMPSRNGAEANHAKPHADLKKWPSYFQDLGYEVVAFGKVSHYKHTGLYGFDHFANDTFHDHAGISAATQFLKARTASPGASAKKPLCLMVGSNWPHVPWPATELSYDPSSLTLPAKTIDTPATREWLARYATAVTHGDNDLGAVLTAVKENLPEKTIICFSSDHGAQWPFAKWNLYEAGVAVPLIISWPGVIKPSTRTSALVSWVDLLPTLLEAAGGKAPPGIDGRSFLTVLRGESASHRDRIFTTHANDAQMNVYPARAVRDEQWKYIRNLHPEFAFTTHIDIVGGELGGRSYFASWEAKAQTDPQAASIMQKYHQRPAEELYDLSADPHEQRNLASDALHGAKLASLRSELDAWISSQKDTLPVLSPPRLLNDPTSWGPKAEIRKEEKKTTLTGAASPTAAPQGQPKETATATAPPSATTPPGKRYTYKHSGGKPQDMEIYFPPNHDPAKAKAPGVLLFHGGAWVGGDLKQMQAACHYLASRGMVAATANYQMLSKPSIAKLKPGHSFKRVCVIDAKSALRWLKQHAGELGIDSERIITGGGSAGGHISVIATTNPALNDPADNQEISTSVIGYLLFNPAFSPEDHRDPQIDVLQHLKPGFPPAVVFFGTADQWKPGWDTALKKMRAIGCQNTEVWLASDQPHSFFNKDPWKTLTLIEADRFFSRQAFLSGEPTLNPPTTGEKLAKEN